MNGNSSSGPLAGLMMVEQLMISSILEHAARWHGDTEIVSRGLDKKLTRATYKEVAARTAQLAHALVEYGIRPGDRLATLAWNSQRHFELYYAISGIGAVMFLDPDLAPILEPLVAKLPHVEAYVVLCDDASLPNTSLPNVRSYEAFIAGKPQTYAWPVFDERTASSLCYTSGTTGNPKGALYSHRSTVLHAMSGSVALHARDGKLNAVLPVVPMFHANAWGLPYIAPMLGAKLVFPGPHLDPESVYELFENEKVDFTAGVPTVWFRLLAWMKEKNLRFSTLTALGVGGSASPASMITALEDGLGVECLQGWGMTETSPICTSGWVKKKHDTPEQRLNHKLLAGRVLYGVNLKLVDEDGNVLPDDGETQGELLVRGNWVTSAYFEDEAATARQFTSDGWFRTGDIATLDPDGYVAMRDRVKDVIKSGGEWISSIDLENVAIGAPGVAEAAAIGVYHSMWSERPILVIVRAPSSTVTKEDILAYLEGKIVKWWTPDDVLFMDELPHTATGKVSKRLLRDLLKDYKLQEA